MHKKILCILALVLLTACSSNSRNYTVDNLESYCFGNYPTKNLTKMGDYYYHGGIKQSLHRCPSDDKVYSESGLYSTSRQLIVWTDRVTIQFSRDITEVDLEAMKVFDTKLKGDLQIGVRQYTFSVKSLALSNALFEQNRTWIKRIDPLFKRFTGF